MNILLTNISMAGISGTEQYTRTLAVALAARGHGVEVFAPMAAGHSVVPAFSGIKVVHSIDEVGFLPDIR